MTDQGSQVDNPFFARLWTYLSQREPEAVLALRRENLAGLSGRVLEVGAGTGTNFAFYPATVTEVVAVEPEPRLAKLAASAAEAAAVPVTVSSATVESFSDAEPFDAIVCSLVLCSINDPDSVLRQLLSLLKPGGQLRYLEHIASDGSRARLQQFADATFWPSLFGNCHTHRDTETSIARAGFRVKDTRRTWVMPRWLPVPTAEVVVGRAVRSEQAG
jgi:SAM-dependent methyltransferase